MAGAGHRPRPTSNKIAWPILARAAADDGARRLQQRDLCARQAPAKPGYALPAGGGRRPAAAEAPEGEPLPALLAKADPTKGEADTKVCQSCHSFEKGGAAKVGPPLYGVDRPPEGLRRRASPIPTA